MDRDATLDEVFGGIAQLMAEVPLIMQELGKAFEQVLHERADVLLAPRIAVSGQETGELREIALRACQAIFADACVTVKLRSEMVTQLNAAQHALHKAEAMVALLGSQITAKQGLEQ